LASSLNGSESNLTPAPPTTPKNTFTRTFQQQLLPKDLTGRPPRPTNNLNNSLSLTENIGGNHQSELSKTAPGSLTSSSGINNNGSNNFNGLGIPPSPPTTVKTRPNYRGGWNSAERIMSGSLRLSRASTRTSLASEDLEKYMNTTNGLGGDKYGGSLNNVENANSTLQPIGFSNQNNNNSTANINSKPLPQPRNSSSSSVTNNSNNRIMSGRNQETGMSTSSYDIPNYLSQIPPPIKV
jgi:hypothetical protein